MSVAAAAVLALVTSVLRTVAAQSAGEPPVGNDWNLLPLAIGIGIAFALLTIYAVLVPEKRRPGRRRRAHDGRGGDGTHGGFLFVQDGRDGGHGGGDGGSAGGGGGDGGGGG